ncbi:cupin domain-containing protein [Kibdelosporangium aridum]|uniref:Mannose-6-phosphate isomerase, cupin superfamily n=1 Tax=Kibdelosporangium aridum TaxID=2030 RepID=A0A1Y5XVQ1_KIBAR|nr:cupin domain-containing protein [Kibdelosporangium aridum]SMD19381.1 Mannose-6-phosphate isomerase, cupin superfamily [Kibdelosporangium aridum]
MGQTPQAPSLLIRPSEVEPFDRGEGIVTLPMVGKWNSTQSSVTTGVTSFAPGTGIPLHSHNVDECVLVLEGEATVTIGEDEFDVDAGVNTWVPAGVPHRFVNRGDSLMRIFWIYGGLQVTRTITATGQTFEHLSAHDRQ